MMITIVCTSKSNYINVPLWEIYIDTNFKLSEKIFMVYSNYIFYFPLKAMGVRRDTTLVEKDMTATPVCWEVRALIQGVIPDP